MSEIVKLEYSEGQYIDIEMKQNNSFDGGLGGATIINKIGHEVFNRSVQTVASFLNTAAEKIKSSFNNSEVSDISITVGVAFGTEGNLFIGSSTSEVNFSATVTFKGER